MSRWLEINDEGKRAETIESVERCKHLINEVCCEGCSAIVGDYPSDEDCLKCKFFVKEDGVIAEE